MTMNSLIGVAVVLLVSVIPVLAGIDANDCVTLSGHVAVDSCTRALESAGPRSRPELRLARGNAHFLLGVYHDAFDDFNAAISNDPTNGGAYLDRGAALYHLGQYLRAIGDYDRALALEPRLNGIRYDRGLSHFFLGRFADTARDFDKAVRYDPDDARALYCRGLSKAHLGQSGADDFVAARRLDPHIAAKFAQVGMTA